MYLLSESGASFLLIVSQNFKGNGGFLMEPDDERTIHQVLLGFCENKMVKLKRE